MSVTVLGFAWDASSSYARGSAQGPAAIRAALWSDMSSVFSLSGHDTAAAITGYDFADLPDDPAQTRAAIRGRVADVVTAGRAPLCLGGDHSVTFPILRAMRDAHGPVNVLHIDAHPDTYASFDGDPYSHACPFARAVEDGCIAKLVQVGLRSVSPDARTYGAAHNITMLGADQIGEIPFEHLHAPLYLSLDLDGIDPAFAPGVSHPEPGGLTSREVISLIGRLPQLVGADIVELNPGRDVAQLTTNLAARLVKEITAKLV